MNYEILNIDEFVDGSRTLIYSTFLQKKPDLEKLNLKIDQLSEAEQKEIEECLTHRECLLMLEPYIKTKNGIQMISEKKYIDYLTDLNGRMVSNILKNLASKGYIETAFDDEINDFVFWTKEDIDENPA